MGEQLIDGQNIRSCEKKNIKSCGAKQKPLLCFCLAGPYCIWHTQCLLKKKKKKFLDSRQIYAALLHVSRPDCTLYQGGTETHKHVQAQYVLSGMLWITSRHQYECFFLGGEEIMFVTWSYTRNVDKRKWPTVLRTNKKTCTEIS